MILFGRNIIFLLVTSFVLLPIIICKTICLKSNSERKSFCTCTIGYFENRRSANSSLQCEACPREAPWTELGAKSTKDCKTPEEYGVFPISTVYLIIVLLTLIALLPVTTITAVSAMEAVCPERDPISLDERTRMFREKVLREIELREKSMPIRPPPLLGKRRTYTPKPKLDSGPDSPRKAGEASPLKKGHTQYTPKYKSDSGPDSARRPGETSPLKKGHTPQQNLPVAFLQKETAQKADLSNEVSTKKATTQKRDTAPELGFKGPPTGRKKVETTTKPTVRQMVDALATGELPLPPKFPKTGTERDKHPHPERLYRPNFSQHQHEQSNEEKLPSKFVENQMQEKIVRSLGSSKNQGNIKRDNPKKLEDKQANEKTDQLSKFDEKQGKGKTGKSPNPETTPRKDNKDNLIKDEKVKEVKPSKNAQNNLSKNNDNMQRMIDTLSYRQPDSYCPLAESTSASRHVVLKANGASVRQQVPEEGLTFEDTKKQT